VILHDAPQRSGKWYEARAGRPTASSFDKILTSTGKASTQRSAYACQLAGERLLGVSEEIPLTRAMERGIELESEAFEAYALITDEQPVEVGLCLSDDLRYGCSPDGLCGDDGGLELKCPGLPKHVEYLVCGTLPTAYFAQVQGCLFVTRREWWDFMSYYPGLPPFILRVTPDEAWHDLLREALAEFCDRVDEIESRLRALQ
jgi:hypothetical protein